MLDYNCFVFLHCQQNLICILGLLTSAYYKVDVVNRHCKVTLSQNISKSHTVFVEVLCIDDGVASSDRTLFPSMLLCRT